MKESDKCHKLMKKGEKKSQTSEKMLEKDKN